jgi:hypothetical protein
LIKFSELVLIEKIWYNRDMKKEYKRTNYPSDLTDRQWEKVMQFLVRETRIKAGRNAEPSYALIDSQSVKTAYRSDKKGYDGGKKRKTNY